MRFLATALAATLFGLLAIGAAEAQDTLLSRMVHSQRGRLRLVVLNGRICLKWTRLIQISSTSGGSNNTKESFQITNQNGRLNLSYSKSSDDELVNVVVSGLNDAVSINRRPRGKSNVVPVEYRQDPRNDLILLSVGEGADRQTYRAKDLWQLLLVRREECETHLYPLLEMVRQDWKIAETVVDVEDKLMHGISEEIVQRRARWASLVEQLGDDSFAKREAADRALRAEGAAAVGFLRRLDLDRLDAEQRFRVRRILDAVVEEDGEDTPEEIAQRLAGEPDVWLALLARPELETRKTAAKQLSILLGESIDVDPNADPDSQKEQRDRLQKIIGNL
ncbi:MAG: hypothetical protein JW959_14270 [Pirellulales bacterium]|nr:hypothetical protein [Pirellulales bacterium]